MVENFNPNTLIVARESRGFTQQELAESIKYPQSTLSKIENGNQHMDDDLLKEIINFLDYPKSFFLQEMVIYPSNLHYRKKSDVSSKTLYTIEAHMNIYRTNIQKLIRSIEMPVTKLPFTDKISNLTPRDAAKYMRQYWSVPKGPIDNISKIIEDNGIIIIPMDFGTDKIDGRSMITSNGNFIIFINNKLSGDRLRFTLAHELAHIVLHISSLNVFETDIEKEAMIFASEFLMPEIEIKRQLMGDKITMAKLADLKRYWKTSMQAILYWAAILNVVTQNQAKYLWGQFSSLRIKMKEPIDIPVESPTLFKEITTGFIKHLGYTKEELSNTLSISLKDLDTFYFIEEKKLLTIVR